MGDVTVSSTTDDLAKVRAAAGLQEELTEQEKQEQTEQQEFEHARTENGNAPQRDRRMYVLASKWREAERERDELRQRLAEVERNQANAPLDRVLAAEYRAAELEEKLRAYEHGGGVAYANPPPDSTEEQASEQAPEQAPPEPQSQQNANEASPEFRAFQEQHNRKLTDILSKRQDGNELVARAAPIIQGMRQDVSEAISYALQNSPNSEHVIIYLMEHPDLLHQANALSPQDAFTNTLRLAGRLETPNSQPRTVPVSRAPAPIRPLSGHAKIEQKDPGEMSLPEYRKWYDRNFTRGRR